MNCENLTPQRFSVGTWRLFCCAFQSAVLRVQRIAEYSTIHSWIYCSTRKMEAKYLEAEHPALLTHDPHHARFVPCPARMCSSVATWGLSSKQECIRNSCRRPSQGEREAGMQASEAWCFYKEPCLFTWAVSCTTTSWKALANNRIVVSARIGILESVKVLFVGALCCTHTARNGAFTQCNFEQLYHLDSLQSGG